MRRAQQQRHDKPGANEEKGPMSGPTVTNGSSDHNNNNGPEGHPADDPAESGGGLEGGGGDEQQQIPPPLPFVRLLDFQIELAFGGDGGNRRRAARARRSLLARGTEWLSDLLSFGSSADGASAPAAPTRRLLDGGGGDDYYSQREFYGTYLGDVLKSHFADWFSAELVGNGEHGLLYAPFERVDLKIIDETKRRRRLLSDRTKVSAREAEDGAAPSSEDVNMGGFLRGTARHRLLNSGEDDWVFAPYSATYAGVAIFDRNDEDLKVPAPFAVQSVQLSALGEEEELLRRIQASDPFTGLDRVTGMTASIVMDSDDNNRGGSGDGDEIAIGGGGSLDNNVTDPATPIIGGGRGGGGGGGGGYAPYSSVIVVAIVVACLSFVCLCVGIFFAFRGGTGARLSERPLRDRLRRSATELWKRSATSRGSGGSSGGPGHSSETDESAEGSAGSGGGGGGGGRRDGVHEDVDASMNTERAEPDDSMDEERLRAARWDDSPNCHRADPTAWRGSVLYPETIVEDDIESSIVEYERYVSDVYAWKGDGDGSVASSSSATRTWRKGNSAVMPSSPDSVDSVSRYGFSLEGRTVRSETIPE